MSIPSMSSITDFPSSAVHGRRLSNMKEARGDRRDVARGGTRGITDDGSYACGMVVGTMAQLSFCCW